MTAYVIRRTIQIALTLVLFVTVVFFMLQAQPGDITVQYALNPDIPPEARESIQERFGLGKPVWEQWALYMKNIVTGDLGVSFGQYPRPVMDILLERLPRTLMLFMTAAVISFYLGFVMGKILAWRRGGITEYVSTIGGVALYTVFTPWFALLIIWLFAVQLDLFPVGKFIDVRLWRTQSVAANTIFKGMLISAASLSAFLFVAYALATKLKSAWKGVIFRGVAVGSLGMMALAWSLSGVGHLALDIIEHMVLPVMVLTLISFAGTMLLTRSSMLESIREDYIMAARAKGLPESVIRDKHAARNALLPVVTSLVFSLAFAIDGGVITESIFSWPGIGLTLLQSVTEEDIPLAVGALVITGIFALVAHLVADVLYAYLDPRIRYQ
ncbi:MAG: ABC transporter permease [Dehalococcoidia bacterium DG_22]|nr:MAG: ABC transporter permease [Dehalococcoidia bacterium DG_22]